MHVDPLRVISQLDGEIVKLKEELRREADRQKWNPETLEAVVRVAVHREYYLKYGEWDWIVRERYMEKVKSVARLDHWDDNTRGYIFRLHNCTPSFQMGDTDQNDKPNPVGVLRPYRFDSLRRSTQCAFVMPENIETCKLTQKTADAFLILKHLLENDDTEEEGFGISRQEESWGEFNNRGERHDYEGWKFHLVHDASASGENEQIGNKLSPSNNKA